MDPLAPQMPETDNDRIHVASYQKRGTHVISGDVIYCSPTEKAPEAWVYAKYRRQDINEAVINACDCHYCKEAIKRFGLGQ